MKSYSSLGFPLRVTEKGAIYSSDKDEAINSKIVQILFTTPGERVNLPDFGCGLLNLTFEPNDEILASSTEFTIRQALTKWLSNDIVVNDVNITNNENNLVAQIAYTRKDDFSVKVVRLHFN